ncbi:MAG: hypothetical protein KIS92_08360 [Planctomycetota bacterium]|nr:hypothetical protein [Planctomycetota bacterium]
MRELLPLCGAVLLGIFVSLLFLSDRFLYGTGHTDRPILGTVAWLLVASGCYGLAVWATLREERRARPPLLPKPIKTLVWVLFVGIAARGFLLPSRAIQEVDYCRYMWDGATVANGMNPYMYAPIEVKSWHGFGGAPSLSADPDPRDRETWSKQLDLIVSSPEAIDTFKWINHPEVRTIYPPLAQGLFALAYLIKPWSLPVLRGLFLLCEIGTVLLLFDILRRFRLSPLRILIYAWSPLAIKELANSPHVDALVVFTMALALWTWLRVKTARGAPLVGMALGLCVLAKTFPLILLPAALWAARKRWNLGAAAWLFAACAATVLAGYAPFISGSHGGLFDGFFTFAAAWHKNSGAYGVIAWLCERVAGEARWTILGHERLAAEWLARGIAGGCIAACTLFAAVGRFPRLWLEPTPAGASPIEAEDPAVASTRDLAGAWLIALAALFLFAPTGNPWYATWLLPFLCLLPSRALLLLTALLPLYYLHFYVEYHAAELTAAGYATALCSQLVRAAQFLPVWALLGWDLSRARRARA